MCVRSVHHQNRLKLLFWLDYGKHHHAGLDDAKALKKMNTVTHSEGCQNVDDKDHRKENLKMGLKHFVLVNWSS